jgi:hypothetical protein
MLLSVEDVILDPMKNSFIASNSDRKTLRNNLEKIVAQSVQPLSVDAGCRLALGALITEGVNRMVLEERVADEDVALACDNLKHFLHEMKVEAVLLGHPEKLTYDSFRSARDLIENHAILTSFTLWPFWPSEFGQDKKRQS